MKSSAQILKGQFVIKKAADNSALMNPQSWPTGMQRTATWKPLTKIPAPYVPGSDGGRGVADMHHLSNVFADQHRAKQDEWNSGVRNNAVGQGVNWAKDEASRRMTAGVAPVFDSPKEQARLGKYFSNTPQQVASRAAAANPGAATPAPTASTANPFSAPAAPTNSITPEPVSNYMSNPSTNVSPTTASAIPNVFRGLPTAEPAMLPDPTPVNSPALGNHRTTPQPAIHTPLASSITSMPVGLQTGNSGQLPTGTVAAEQTPWLDNLTTGSGVTGIMDGYRQSIGEPPTLPPASSDVMSGLGSSEVTSASPEPNIDVNPASTAEASAQNPIVRSMEMNGPTDWGAIFRKQTGTAFDPRSKMDRLNMQRLQNQQSTYNRRQYGYGGNVKTSSVGFLMKLAAGLYVPTTGGYPSATGVMTGAVQLPGIETTPAAPWTTTSATGKINAAGNAGSGAVSTLSNPTRGRNQSAFDGGRHITSRDAVSSIYGGSRLGTTSAKIHKWLAPLLKRYPGRAGLLGLLGLGGVGGMGYGLKNLMGDKEEVAKGVGMGMQRGSLGAMTGMRDYLGNQGFMDRLFNGKTLSGLDQIIAGMQGGGVKTSSTVASLRNHLETLLVDKLATEIEEDLPEKYRNRRSLANLLSGAGAGALAGGVMGHASGGSALGGAGAGALIGGGLGYGMNKLRGSLGLDAGANDLNAAAVDPEMADKLHRRRQLAVLLPLLLGGTAVGGVAGAAGSEDGSRLAGGSMGALLGALAGGTAGATHLGMSGLMGLDPMTGGVAHYARPKTAGEQKPQQGVKTANDGVDHEDRRFNLSIANSGLGGALIGALPGLAFGRRVGAIGAGVGAGAASLAQLAQGKLRQFAGLDPVLDQLSDSRSMGADGETYHDRRRALALLSPTLSGATLGGAAGAVLKRSGKGAGIGALIGTLLGQGGGRANLAWRDYVGKDPILERSAYNAQPNNGVHYGA